MKRVIVISTSLRRGSNSDMLADKFAEGARSAGNDVVVWATPIYYYEMSGQMKTLIDRMNAMYPLCQLFQCLSCERWES